MSAPESGARPALDPAIAVRLASAAVAIGTGTVLGLAIWLEPSAAGHGTHLQLGLGECSFLTLTGQPCPMCGATTTFALMGDLRVVAALINQPFATLLFLLTAGAFGISVAEVVQPRRRWGRLLDWIEPWEGRLAAGFLTFMGVAWIWKIYAMSGGGPG